MDWREAFGRAAQAILASVVILIVGLVPLLLGVRMIVRNLLAVDAWLGGGLLVLAGLLFISAGPLAVMIKTLTAAVADQTGQRTSMSWSEAFGRAAAAILFIALISIIGAVPYWLGDDMLDGNPSAVELLIGWLLVLAGLLVSYIGCLAVAIKTFSTAMVDYILP